MPQVEAANSLGALIKRLQGCRAEMHELIERAESMHDNVESQAHLLTAEGAERMAAVRDCCDALELAVGDEYWPLPKYREMLFPV